MKINVLCVWESVFLSAWPRVLIINRCCHFIWINLQTQFHNWNKYYFVCVFSFFPVCSHIKYLFHSRVVIPRQEEKLKNLKLNSHFCCHLHEAWTTTQFNIHQFNEFCSLFFRNLFFPSNIIIAEKFELQIQMNSHSFTYTLHVKLWTHTILDVGAE